MKIKKYLQRVLTITVLAVTAVFFSCDEFKDVEYDIAIAIECMGGTGAIAVKDKFTALLLFDGKQTFNIPTTTSGFAAPVGKKTKITITATKLDETSTLIIMVFKNGSIDDKGYSMLPSCTTSTTSSCTNSLTLAWELNPAEDTTKAVSGSSTTSSSSSSTSSSTTE